MRYQDFFKRYLRAEIEFCGIGYDRKTIQKLINKDKLKPITVATLGIQIKIMYNLKQKKNQ